MDVAAGAMGPLLPKLAELQSEEYHLHKGVKKDIAFLEAKMRIMQAAILEAAEVPRDQLDERFKIWAGECRELSYQMEDIVDSILIHHKGSALPAGPEDGFKGLTKKMKTLFQKGKTRRQMADELKDIKSQVQELAARYKLVGIKAAKDELDDAGDNLTTTTTIDPRVSAPYKDQKELVGIDGAKYELIELLTNGDDGLSKQQLKILSIVGFGGLGKTTLAKTVYSKIQPQFDCAAFVSVGQSPEVKRVFKEILFGIDEQNYTGISAAALDENQYIDELRGLLHNKRYLIVLDDIWDLRSWEIIACALIDNNLGSIVITTTRIVDVAVRAGLVYKLSPLSDVDSIRLFYTSLPGVESFDQISELVVVKKILKKCCGVPLAIITIASLLSNRPIEDWYKVYRSIDLRHGDINTLEGMRAILSHSYYDLPPYLKTCLLYLSIFPEDYMVMKDTLIWKWIAEGFVQQKPGVGLFELGERYFNQLINRSLVQPVGISGSGIIISCRVHDMVLDFIRSIASDENFVTILDGNGQQTYSQNKVRRLALQNRVVEQHNPLVNMDMPQVRSFSAIMCHTSMMESLSRIQFLRVLAIEGCSFMEGDAYHLEHLGRLLHLRYLGLWKTPIRELPKTMGALKFLQTLDLRQTKIQKLPRSVILLSHLRCLRANGGSIRVPDWIGKLTSLEELSLNDVSNCPNFVKELGELTELRDLKIWIRVLDERSKKALVKSLVNLQKIQVLHLDGGLWIDEADWEGYMPP